MGVVIAVQIYIKITFMNPTFLCIKKAVIKKKVIPSYTSFLRWLGQEDGSCAFYAKKQTQEELVCEPTTCSVHGSVIEFTNKKQTIGRTTTQISSGRVI